MSTYKFKIEVSKLITSIILILGIFNMLVLTDICILLSDFQKSILVYLIFIAVYSYIFSILFARVKIDSDYLYINCSLICNKKIKLSDITEVYEAEKSDVMRGSPAYSKNIIAIKYRGKNTDPVYVSIKNKSEFINCLNQQRNAGVF